MGRFIGDRSGETFEKFYEKMKPLKAVFYSDGWKKGEIPPLWDGKTAKRIVTHLISLHS